MLNDETLTRMFYGPPQVRFLEQENKRLETKWSVLQEQTISSSKTTDMFQNHIAHLRRYLDGLDMDKRHLDSELSNIKSLVEDFKQKYGNMLKNG